MRSQRVGFIDGVSVNGKSMALHASGQWRVSCMHRGCRTASDV